MFKLGLCLCILIPVLWGCAVQPEWERSTDATLQELSKDLQEFQHELNNFKIDTHPS